MRVLVDLHAFIWELLDAPRSSSEARQVMSSDEDGLVLSLVSLWEASIKIQLGKLKPRGLSVSYLQNRMEEYGMELLPIQYEHVLMLETLPRHHGDPFDRLLIAQAIVEKLPILTDDDKFKAYPVELVW